MSIHRLALSLSLAALTTGLAAPARAQFCGDEESIVDVAWMDLEAGDPEHAQMELTTALLHGTVAGWEKPQALAVLAEAQLRMGHPRPAAINFERALELDPSLQQTATAMGLATALLHLGRVDKARATAQAFLESSCGDDGWAVACYGAHRILSITADDPAKREQATEAAVALRGADEAFDMFDELLGIPRADATDDVATDDAADDVAEASIPEAS